MLVSTVFTTILSNLANFEGTWIFNIFFPLIFSLVPLALYEFFKGKWGSKIAFLSVVFFVSTNVFHSFRSNSRQMIAEFFFVLLFLVFFKKDMNNRHKWLLIGLFSFGLIVSYYTLNYVFLFIILATFLLTTIFYKEKVRKIFENYVI